MNKIEISSYNEPPQISLLSYNVAFLASYTKANLLHRNTRPQLVALFEA